MRDLAGNVRDRWIVSYADFLTLLFATFVLLYSVANVSLENYKAVLHALDIAFKDNEHIDIEQAKREALNNIPIEELIKRIEDKLAKKELNTKEANALMDVAKKAQQKDASVVMAKPEDWLEIELKAMFPSSSAFPKEEALPVLQLVAGVLKNYSKQVSIGGYTDNKPIQTDQFPSNWELSASRAAAIVRVLEENGVDKKRLTAIGYGETYPIASNETDDGRRRNRRIVLLIALDKGIEQQLRTVLAGYMAKKTSLFNPSDKVEVQLRKLRLTKDKQRLPGDFEPNDEATRVQ